MWAQHGGYLKFHVLGALGFQNVLRDINISGKGTKHTLRTSFHSCSFTPSVIFQLILIEPLIKQPPFPHPLHSMRGRQPMAGPPGVRGQWGVHTAGTSSCTESGVNAVALRLAGCDGGGWRHSGASWDQETKKEEEEWNKGCPTPPADHHCCN